MLLAMTAGLDSRSVAASLLWPKEAELDIDVDLPEGFDSPFEDDEEVRPDASPDAFGEPLSEGIIGSEEDPTADLQEEEPENISRR